MPKKTRGRPNEGRKRINIYLKPEVIVKIDQQKDDKQDSRGKVIESKF